MASCTTAEYQPRLMCNTYRDLVQVKVQQYKKWKIPWNSPEDYIIYEIHWTEVMCKLYWISIESRGCPGKVSWTKLEEMHIHL